MSRLIVAVPAIAGRLKQWGGLVDRLKREPLLSGSTWLLYDHNKGWLSVADCTQLARSLRAKIDQEWSARGPFDDVILVGHSLGGLLVRQAYLYAQTGDEITMQTSAWATRVSRIVLLAGANRGVDTKRFLALRFFAWLVRALQPLQRLLLCQILRGSDFITNLRIQWIRVFEQLGNTAPVVVQLLGTEDWVVTRDDSIDIQQFPSGYYIEVPDANHANLYEIDGTRDPEGRYALLKDAFVNPTPIKGQSIRVDPIPDDVVFVLHGIRANNRTWVEQTIRRIRERFPSVLAIGPGYSYFSAFRFAIPMFRRRNLEWFQDTYSETLARNPRARFAFIGHSNGTYLFGESLRRIPGMRFERAVLVGSVLPAEYDWRERFQRGQVVKLRVDGSAYDWPVAWLCRALRSIGMKDIGTGGYDGFVNVAGPQKHEFFWYEGGHSAPLEPSNLDALVDYAVADTITEPRLGGDIRWFGLVSRALGLLSLPAFFALVLLWLWAVVMNPPAALSVLVTMLIVVIILDII